MFDGILPAAPISMATKRAIETAVRRHSAKAIARKGFKTDPLLEHNLSGTALKSSAVKRHGFIIELAICDALRASGNYKVWHNIKFLVSKIADQQTDQLDTNVCLSNRVPYGAKPVGPCR